MREFRVPRPGLSGAAFSSAAHASRAATFDGVMRTERTVAPSSGTAGFVGGLRAAVFGFDISRKVHRGTITGNTRNGGVMSIVVWRPLRRDGNGITTAIVATSTTEERTMTDTRRQPTGTETTDAGRAFAVTRRAVGELSTAEASLLNKVRELFAAHPFLFGALLAVVLWRWSPLGALPLMLGVVAPRPNKGELRRIAVQALWDAKLPRPSKTPTGQELAAALNIPVAVNESMDFDE